MKPGRVLFLTAGLCTALFLAVGAWMFAVSGQWRLLAAAALTFVFGILAMWQHRRNLRSAEPGNPEGRRGDSPLKIALARGERKRKGPRLQWPPWVPGSWRCSPFTQRTVPVEARMTTLSVEIMFLRRLTPSSSEPSVTPVAAKITSPWARSSRS